MICAPARETHRGGSPREDPLAYREQPWHRTSISIGLAVAGAFIASEAAAGGSLEVRGLLDAGIDRAWGDVDWAGHAPGDRLYRDKGVFPSRLTIRATEDFGLGWQVGVTLEQGFDGQTGLSRCPADDQGCGVDSWFNRARHLEVRHYAYGRLRIGHQAALGREPMDIAHPWAGETVATDDGAAMLAWRCDAAQQTDGPANPRACIEDSGHKRGQSARYDLPQWGGWKVALQHGLKPDRTHLTVRVTYQQGGMAMSAAIVKTSQSTQVYPLAAVVSLGGVRLHAGHTRGQGAVRSRSYNFVGASTHVGRGELRAGLARYRAGPESSHDKLALGWHRPLGHRVIAYADVALIKFRETGQRGGGLDAGLRVSF